MRDEGEEEEEVLFDFCRAAAAEAAARGGNFNMKKIIFLVLVILLISAGGFFWWQESQKDVKELNKNLPDGIKVTKSFLGEYKVINKIDGYEFKAPKEWRGVGNIDRYEVSKNSNRLIIESPPAFVTDLIALDRYKEEVEELKPWIIDLYRSLLGIEGGLTGYEIQEEELGSLKVIKLKEISPTVSISYFFQNKNKSTIYELRSVIWTEESIREIITNGKW